MSLRRDFGKSLRLLQTMGIFEVGQMNFLHYDISTSLWRASE